MYPILRKCMIFLSVLLMSGGICTHALAEEKSEGYTLEEVVILSRHNIRSPLSAKGSILEKSTPHKWFEWSSAAGELSLRGGVLETEMGEYFRKWTVSEELLSENYRPQGNEIRIYANAKQRTIATSRYFTAGFLPTADVPIETHAPYDEMDPVFNPQLTFVSEDYRKDAEQQMLGMIPDLSEEYALLAEVIDYTESEGYRSGELTDFVNGDNEIILELYKEPAMTGSLKNATSIADALTLQYYEEEDEKAAAFGHDITYDQWKELSSIKDCYTDALFTAPLISVHIANPLLQVIDSELERTDRKFTFLCGHDSNIASVLSALDVTDYEAEHSIEKKTPIGSKLVFEKWKDSNGKEYIRTRLVYQNSDQLRSMPLLTLDSPPMSHEFEIPGLTRNTDGLVPYEDFNAFLDGKIKAFEDLKKEYGITDPTVNYTMEVPDTADR